MPTTYKKAPKEVKDLAQIILNKYESYEPVLSQDVRIDILMAYGERDDASGELKGPALKRNGVVARGITRIVNLKDRTKGLGDVEICLDADFWEDATIDQQRSLLDHELHHIIPTGETDDLRRPVIKLRKHDYEFGWFKIIAARNSEASLELQQAAKMMAKDGQLFWPGLAGAGNAYDAGESVARAMRGGSITVEHAGQSVTLSADDFSKISKRLGKSSKA